MKNKSEKVVEISMAVGQMQPQGSLEVLERGWEYLKNESSATANQVLLVMKQSMQEIEKHT